MFIDSVDWYLLMIINFLNPYLFIQIRSTKGIEDNFRIVVTRYIHWDEDFSWVGSSRFYGSRYIKTYFKKSLIYFVSCITRIIVIYRAFFSVSIRSAVTSRSIFGKLNILVKVTGVNRSTYVTAVLQTIRNSTYNIILSGLF